MSYLMLVKHDLCRLTNTESFLYTISCNVDIVECIIAIGKGILPHKHAKFCLLSLYLLLYIFIEIVYAGVFFLHICLKRHFLNDELRKKKSCIYFP